MLASSYEFSQCISIDDHPDRIPAGLKGRKFCRGGGRDMFKKRRVNPVRHSSGVAIAQRLTGLTGLRRAQKSVQMQAMNFSEDDRVSAKQRLAGEEIQSGTEIKKRSRLITTAAEVCFQLLTRDAYHLSINGAIRVKHQIPIARVHLVQREVDHIRFELNTGGGGTQTTDIFELEIELLVDVTVNYRPKLAG